MAGDPSAYPVPLYHLVQRELWEQAKATSAEYFPPTYQQDGFTHLTQDPAYLLGIGNHFYRSTADDFLLLVLDPLRLTAKVVFEPAAAVGNIKPDGLTEEQAPLFPHLFGSINLDAVARELPVERSSDGHFLSIPGL